jgi:hypothetical protein
VSYAVGSLGLLETEYEEFAAFDVQVLNPERTLFEKLAILHHLASNYPESEIELRRAARHVYDVFKLLTSPQVRDVLGERPELAVELASDITAISQKWGWAHTPRPAEGYAASPAFDASHPCQEAIAAGWASMRPLIYGEVPALEQCRQAAQEIANLL